MKPGFRESDGESAPSRVACEAPRKLFVCACRRDDTHVLEKQRRRHARHVGNEVEHGLLRQARASSGDDRTTRHKHSSRPRRRQRSKRGEPQQRLMPPASRCQMISCPSGASSTSPCRTMLTPPSRWHTRNHPQSSLSGEGASVKNQGLCTPRYATAAQKKALGDSTTVNQPVDVNRSL